MRLGSLTMLTLILALVKAMGAPLPVWLVVLPMLVDLFFSALLVLMVLVAAFLFGEGSLISRR
jgi:hypothetical protein